MWVLPLPGGWIWKFPSELSSSGAQSLVFSGSVLWTIVWFAFRPSHMVGWCSIVG